MPSTCAASCPLARIPASVWKSLLRPPFRKRHPLLFWGLLLVFLLAVPVAAFRMGSEGVASGPRLGLVRVAGAIMDPEPLLGWIDRLARDDAIKGVLLRVDSPGGGAAASQELYQALRALAEKKPLAASMGATAASGGLMVSMAANRVFANASTVTGSIGVRMDIPQLQGLLGKIGVSQETLATGPYKDAGSYLRPLTAEQRAYFKAVLDDMHRQFVDIVAQGRHMAHAQAAALADGRIFTGREALRLGLVDDLGGQDAALRWLAERCGVPAARPLRKMPEKDRWLPSGLASLLRLEAGEVLARPSPAFLYLF